MSSDVSQYYTDRVLAVLKNGSATVGQLMKKIPKHEKSWYEGSFFNHIDSAVKKLTGDGVAERAGYRAGYEVWRIKQEPTVVQVVQREADQVMGRHAEHARRTRYGGSSPKTRRIAASVIRSRRKYRDRHLL